MIHQLKAVAKQQNLKTVVMIFEPQPLEFFKGYDAPPRINHYVKKLNI